MSIETLLAGEDARLYAIIVAAALLTYGTRIGGHLVLSRFKTLHPRVESALQAVPAAVLSTIVAPSALTRGPLELAAMVLALILCLRVHPILVLTLSLAFLVGLRHLTGAI